MEDDSLPLAGAMGIPPALAALGPANPPAAPRGPSGTAARAGAPRGTSAAARPAPSPLPAATPAAALGAPPPPPHPPTAAGPLPAAGANGHFRALHEVATASFTSVRPRTAAERNSITAEHIAHVFCSLRRAVVTRPRSAADDAAALVALKAHKAMAAFGWPTDGLDREAHCILWGCQVTFAPGFNPLEIALRLKIATPFIIQSPTDPTQHGIWKTFRSRGEELYTKLEAAVLECRIHGSETAIPSAIFAQTRKLLHAYYDARAEMFLPLAATLDHVPMAAAIRNIAGGYIDQAVSLRECLRAADDMVDDGILSASGSDAVAMDNAARVAIARGFLTGLLVGMDRPRHATQLLKEHAEATPNAQAMHGPSLAAMLLGGGHSAALAATLMRQTPPAPSPAPTDKAPPARSPLRGAPPDPGVRGVPAGTYGPLFDHLHKPGFRMDPAGLLYHMQWYSGEYSTPPAWLPPPGPRAAWPSGPGSHPSPPGAIPTPPGRARLSDTLNIPVARPLVGASSPFPSASSQQCLFCNLPGHAQYECPKRFFDTYGSPLPGHLASGEPDPAAWTGGDLTPAARAALVSYLATCGVGPHRRYRVTLAHLSAGTAPALQG